MTNVHLKFLVRRAKTYAWRYWSISDQIMGSARLLSFTVTENVQNKLREKGT